MTELNRTEEQVAPPEFAGRTREFQNPTGVEDWIERGHLNEIELVGTQEDRPGLAKDVDASPAQLPSAKPHIDRSEGRDKVFGTAGAVVRDANATTPLLSDSEIGDLRSRWGNIQADFVDEPRRSVQEADQLVVSAMQRLAEGFANERAALEKQWDTGENVSTEDLRVALQRYRTFFGRLLNAA